MGISKIRVLRKQVFYPVEVDLVYAEEQIKLLSTKKNTMILAELIR
ncbi:conserved hypothetical protein [Oenococcus oeni]|nr:conserved hypothetical protein [Oenococcus oeni]